MLGFQTFSSPKEIKCGTRPHAESGLRQSFAGCCFRTLVHTHSSHQRPGSPLPSSGLRKAHLSDPCRGALLRSKAEHISKRTLIEETGHTLQEQLQLPDTNEGYSANHPIRTDTVFPTGLIAHRASPWPTHNTSIFRYKKKTRALSPSFASCDHFERKFIEEREDTFISNMFA